MRIELLEGADLLSELLPVVRILERCVTARLDIMMRIIICWECAFLGKCKYISTRIYVYMKRMTAKKYMYI